MVPSLALLAWLFVNLRAGNIRIMRQDSGHTYVIYKDGMGGLPMGYIAAMGLLLFFAAMVLLFA